MTKVFLNILLLQKHYIWPTLTISDQLVQLSCSSRPWQRTIEDCDRYHRSCNRTHTYTLTHTYLSSFGAQVNAGKQTKQFADKKPTPRLPTKTFLGSFLWEVQIKHVEPTEMPNPVEQFPVAAAAKAKEITSIMFLHSN